MNGYLCLIKMIIAINTRALPDDYPEDYKYFVSEVLDRITSKNPEHHFIILGDKKNNYEFGICSNVLQIIAGPASAHSLVMKYWLEVKLPALLKKHKANFFLSFDGTCSLSGKVPQYLVFPDIFFDNFSFTKKNRLRFYKKNISKFLEKANSIAVTSDFAKRKIINQYNLDASKIDVVFAGADTKFMPANDEKKNVVKEKYTEGKEFFLYRGSINNSENLINLLKAFSVFKKRQKTNMKLVLAGSVSKDYQSFNDSLKTYKYRNDIVLIQNADREELIKLSSTAYVFINVSLRDRFNTSVIEAMRCAVPIIIPENSSMQEITKDAALYADGTNHTDIADKMMLIYKDEKLHKELIQKGKLISEKYDWDKTAALVWNSILKAADKNL